MIKDIDGKERVRKKRRGTRDFKKKKQKTNKSGEKREPRTKKK